MSHYDYPDPYSTSIDYYEEGCENIIDCGSDERIHVSFDFFDVGPEPDVDGNCRWVQKKLLREMGAGLGIGG